MISYFLQPWRPYTINNLNNIIIIIITQYYWLQIIKTHKNQLCWGRARGALDQKFAFAFAFAFASAVLQRVFSFRLRASVFGRFNIDGINIDIDVTIDIDDKTNYLLQHWRP